MKRIQDIEALVQPLGQVFTKPSRILLLNIIEGWILCPCRRYVTSILHFGDPLEEHAHDAYHRFFRAGAWTTAHLFRALAVLLVSILGHPNVLWVLGDDTVHKKTGRKVDGAKSCRGDFSPPLIP